MTLLELFNRIIKKDSYEVLIWLKFLANKIDCKDCIATKKTSSGKPPDCSKCVPAAPLIKSNFKKEV